MIRDRLVCGIANERWQQKVLAEEDLTYEKAYKLLLSLEASEKEVKDFSSSSSSNFTSQVHQLRRRQHQRSPPTALGSTSSAGAKQNVQKCFHCGGDYHNLDKCRLKDAECRYCCKKGHIAAVFKHMVRNNKS